MAMIYLALLCHDQISSIINPAALWVLGWLAVYGHFFTLPTTCSIYILRCYPGVVHQKCMRDEAILPSCLHADAHSFDYMLVHSREAMKFDPDGNYVRRWLPVLGRMPAKWIHRCSPV